MEPVGVIVLEHLPDTLLEVRGGYDLAKLARWEAHLPDVAAGRLYSDVAYVQPLGAQLAPLQHQFAAPSLPIFGHQPPDRRSAPLSVKTPYALQRPDVCPLSPSPGNARFEPQGRLASPPQ